jgi:hypothetical protein
VGENWQEALTRRDDVIATSGVSSSSSVSCVSHFYLALSIPRDPEMPDPMDHLQTVGEIVQGFRALGLEPVLVGGMALVVLGSLSMLP